MRRAREASRWLRTDAEAGDAALAAILAVTAQLEIWLTGAVAGSRGIAAPVAIVITGAVAWRRRAPLWAAAVVAIAYAVQELAAGYLDGAISVNVAIVIALYSVAAYEEAPRAVIGGALILGA